ESLPRRVAALGPTAVGADMVGGAPLHDLPGVAILPHERVLQLGEPEPGHVLPGVASRLVGEVGVTLHRLQVAAATLDVAVAQPAGAPDRRLGHPAEIDGDPVRPGG